MSGHERRTDEREPAGRAGRDAGEAAPAAAPASGPADEELLAAAREAAEAAARLHREEAGRVDPSEWDEKAAFDFVTEVDRAAERAIVDVLRARFPGHEIVGEEETEGAAAGSPRGDSRGEPGASRTAPVRWVVDPLDGTTNWLHGYPEYAVSVAALDGRGARVGVVLNSATGERFEAVRGGGSRRDGEPIRVSGVSDLRLGLLGTGFPFRRPVLLPFYLETLERAIRAASGVRRAGSAALDLCDVACGRLDAFWELWLLPWDVAAGALILREAGGRFGPLSLEAEPPAGEARDLLGEAMAGARAFVQILEGGGAGANGADWRAPGAFMAANASLWEPLRRALSSPA